ncbi:hypothetical protein VHUM_03046 [Vanrija humicola]|uniref:Flavoprotein domain-containing protein n=1 Tax=Vanrija humicola TaxID=5417 RepID=A0A7D8Z761_VANHU|nr:hypothetical protein VHUM_03046 [Vanrija humicola]
MDYTPALPDSGYGTPIPPQPIHVPPIKAKPPFLSLQHRPKADDGLFHVLLVSSGSRASCQVPDIIGALSKDPQIALQIVATDRSLRYYNQEAVDAAVRHAWNLAPEASNEFGVTIWTDADDQGRTNLADPVLHMELHKWADIVVVAPCSADMLAKMVQGLSGNLAVC